MFNQSYEVYITPHHATSFNNITYKQMIIDELRVHASTTSSDVVIEEERPTQAPKKREDFYDFDTEDEESTSDDVEAEAKEFLGMQKP